MSSLTMAHLPPPGLLHPLDPTAPNPDMLLALLARNKALEGKFT